MEFGCIEFSGMMTVDATNVENEKVSRITRELKVFEFEGKKSRKRKKRLQIAGFSLLYNCIECIFIVCFFLNTNIIHIDSYNIMSMFLCVLLKFCNFLVLFTFFCCLLSSVSQKKVTHKCLENYFSFMYKY